MAIHLEAATVLEARRRYGAGVADQPADREPLVCVECGRTPGADENADDDWRAVSDGTGELLVFCPQCWRREFGGGK